MSVIEAPLQPERKLFSVLKYSGYTILCKLVVVAKKLRNLGRSGEKYREGILEKKKGNLGNFLSNLSQGLVCTQ